MAYNGYNMSGPANKVIVAGDPLIQELKVETATNVYPSRLVTKGTNDGDIVVGDGISAPMGFAGYEYCNPVFRPDSITSLYAAGAKIPVFSGADCIFKMFSGLAAGTVAKKKDLLLSWSNGQVVPGVNLGGRYAVKVPFTKNTSETQTITLPPGTVLRDVIPNCTTNASGATIDIGTLSTDSGDADGFVDGASLANTGLVLPGMVDATDANNTLGALITEATIKSADTTALYYRVPTGYLIPTGGKVLTYTTSNHTVAGDLYVIVESPGISLVGRAVESVSAASAAANIQIKSLI